MNFKTTIALFVGALILVGCGTMIGQKGRPDIYSRSQAMTTGIVVEGTVVQVRKVKLASGSGFTSVAAGIGGLTGVALTRKSNANTNLIAGLIGAATGGLIGSVAGTTTANEIVVRLPDNTRRAVVQEEGSQGYLAGDTVFLMINGAETRIVESQ